jgi:type I restriction enzyme S subunit
MTDKPQFVGKKVTIGELGKTQSGGTPSSKHPEFFNGSIPWIGTTALNGKFLGKNDAVKLITEEAVAKSATKIVPEKSIMVGIRVGVGKVAINAVPMCTSQDIVSIVGIDEASWNKEYISLALQYKAPLLAAQAQGATIAGITSKTLKAIEIPAIPINEQNRVVDILRKLENQVGFVRKQLCGLDALVKSRFIEMFGDPVEENRWARITLASLCTKLGSGATPRGGKAAYKTSGIPLIRSMNVHNGYFESKDLAYIDEIQAKKLDNVTLHKGDVGSARKVTHFGSWPSMER